MVMVMVMVMILVPFVVVARSMNCHTILRNHVLHAIESFLIVLAKYKVE